MVKKVVCPYCQKKAALVTGKEVYPHRPDLHGKQLWVCQDCDARVGVHKGTTHPLGRLANEELRKAKIRAHEAFDPLWVSGHMPRADAYKWLAGRLGIESKKCHIGWFDVEMCNCVVDAVSEYLEGSE